MQEPNNLETAIVVSQTPNSRAREILMPINQANMLRQVRTLRLEFGNAVPTEGSLQFLQRYSRGKMEWFIAGGGSTLGGFSCNFQTKSVDEVVGRAFA